MKKEIKTPNKTIVILLNIVAALFLIYGIYMLYSSIVYINNYSSYGDVTVSNMIQYVASECLNYFGFAVLLFAASKILSSVSSCCSIPQCETIEESAEEEIAESPVVDEDIEEEAPAEEEPVVEEPVEEPSEEEAVDEEPEVKEEETTLDEEEEVVEEAPAEEDPTEEEELSEEEHEDAQDLSKETFKNIFENK